MNPLCGTCISRSITWARKLRLKRAKRWCARGACRLVETEPQFSQAVISHFLASQGQSRSNALAENMQPLWSRPAVAYQVPDLDLGDSRSPDQIQIQGPTYHRGPISQVPSLCSARWPFGLGRSGKVHTAENGLFIEPQLWSSRPPLITQPQQVSQWAPQGLKGMNYLPSSLGPLQSGNGAGLGAVTSTNWALEWSSQRTKARRNGEFVVGKIRSTGYKRACHSTSIGPQAQGHSLTCLDLSGSLQNSSLPLEKRASSISPFPPPQSPALDRSSQLLPSFVKQAPGRSISEKNPSPSPERSAEVVAPTFMQKIPGHQKFE